MLKSMRKLYDLYSVFGGVRNFLVFMESIENKSDIFSSVSSPRRATSMQDKEKAPNTPGSGVEDIVTLSSNLIKPLKDLDKSLNNPGLSSESPSPPKR